MLRFPLFPNNPHMLKWAPNISCLVLGRGQESFIWASIFIDMFLYNVYNVMHGRNEN